MPTGFKYFQKLLSVHSSMFVSLHYHNDPMSGLGERSEMRKWIGCFCSNLICFDRGFYEKMYTRSIWMEIGGKNYQSDFIVGRIFRFRPTMKTKTSFNLRYNVNLFKWWGCNTVFFAIGIINCKFSAKWNCHVEL